MVIKRKGYYGGNELFLANNESAKNNAKQDNETETRRFMKTSSLKKFIIETFT